MWTGRCRNGGILRLCGAQDWATQASHLPQSVRPAPHQPPAGTTHLAAWLCTSWSLPPASHLYTHTDTHAHKFRWGSRLIGGKKYIECESKQEKQNDHKVAEQAKRRQAGRRSSMQVFTGYLLALSWLLLLPFWPRALIHRARSFLTTQVTHEK